MYIFLEIFIYNEYVRPYFSSHVVSTIFASDPCVLVLFCQISKSVRAQIFIEGY